jgi:flagellar motor switch protein FliN
MVESLEEPSPTSGAESALANELSDMPEESVGAVSLELALSHPDAGTSGENYPKASQYGNSGQVQENRRGEGTMPQGALLKIPVTVQVILGTTRMPLHKVMSLGPGSIVALDRELSEPVVLLVNGNEVARGLIVVVNEKTGQLGISLTEIFSSGSRETYSKPT